MKLIGLMPARNEDWIIGLSARVALRWCDELLVLNHASTDRTAEILANVSGAVVIEESDPTWAEMSHRQRLLEEGRRRRGTHFAIVDADEVLTANLVSYVREWIERLHAGTYLRVGMPAMRSLTEYQSNGIWGQANVTLAFADSPELCWKSTDGYDFHHREPYHAELGCSVLRDFGGVMHLQFANRQRLLAKHALYQMTETLRWPGRTPHHELARTYSLAPDLSDVRLSFVATDWWKDYEPLMRYVDLRSEPWQLAECRRLLAEHGRERFDGLEFFGLL